MNKIRINSIFLIGLTLLVTLLIAGCASSSNNGDRFVMGGTFRLAENETIDGDLSIFGGAVSLDKGSTVNGSVVLIGGTVNVDGTVNGGINGLGGAITLGDTAVVQGDVSTFGASVNKSKSAIVQGSVLSQSENGVQLPNVPRIAVPALFKPFSDAMGSLVRTLVISLLAVLVALFLPNQTRNISKAIDDSPVSAGAIGLLTMIVFPFVIIVLAITILLIPLSLFAILIFGLGLIIGWIAVGYELGERLATLFKGTWAPAVSAGIGTFVLTIVASLANAIPCVGWVIPTLIILVATGGVVISAFGTRSINRPSGGQTIRIETPVVRPTPPVTPVINNDQPVTSAASSTTEPPSAAASFTSRRTSMVVDSSFIQEDTGKPTRSVLKTKPDDSQAEPEKKTKNRVQKPKTTAETDNPDPKDTK